MPIITVQCDVSEHQLQSIDSMRGKLPRSDFLRHAMQLGLCDLTEESCRVAKDQIFSSVILQTNNYQATRELREIAPAPPLPERGTHPQRLTQS